MAATQVLRTKRTPLQLNTICLVVSLLSACQLLGCLSAGHKRNSAWKKDFTYLSMIRAQLAANHNGLDILDCANYKDPAQNAPITSTRNSSRRKSPDNIPPNNWVKQADCYMRDDSNSPAQKMELRNDIIEKFVTLANHTFGDFEHDSGVLRSVTETGFDFINLGLTAGTTVFGNPEPLGAAATAMQGAHHGVNKNFYNDETAIAINSRMEALRLTRLEQIRLHERLPVCAVSSVPAVSGVPGTSVNNSVNWTCYSLAQGMNDVQELFFDGSVHRALQDISNQSAHQAAEAQQGLNALAGSQSQEKGTQKNGGEAPNKEPTPPTPPRQPEAAHR